MTLLAGGRGERATRGTSVQSRLKLSHPDLTREAGQS